MCINPCCNLYSENHAISNTGNYCLTCLKNLQDAIEKTSLNSAERELVKKYIENSFATETEKAEAVPKLNAILKTYYPQCYSANSCVKMAGDTSKFMK